MSLSTTIPPFASLPLFFSQKIILQIQQTVSSKQQLISLLSQYEPDFGSNKSLSIVKEQFLKHLISKQSVQQLLVNFYQWMTEREYSIEEKYHVWNLSYRLVYLISELGVNKQKWVKVKDQEVMRLSNRFSSLNQLNNTSADSRYTPAVLSFYQSQELREYINKSMLPFYEIWQKLLDQTKPFTVKASFFQPIQQMAQFMSLTQGKKLQIQQILSLQFLKQYVGDKIPIEQKKDPKKK